MHTMMLATDGSPSAAEATEQAIDLARELRALLYVVSVAHDTVPVFGYGYGAGEIAIDLHRIQQQHVEKVLDDVRKQTESAGIAVHTLALEGLPGPEICKAARAHDVRLIVIGAHGWGRLGRMIHGSVSQYVLHHAHVPVLVVAGDGEVAELGPREDLVGTASR